MEKYLDNTDKKEYLPPILIEYGTVESITKAGGPGPNFDIDNGPAFTGSITKNG
jgi:hypothetical protein